MKAKGQGKRNEMETRETGAKGKEVFSDIVGVFNGEGPPVPIPNTEVKLTSADDTCLATSRENRSMPTQKEPLKSGSFLFSDLQLIFFLSFTRMGP